jgi:hypothetical protein
MNIWQRRWEPNTHRLRQKSKGTNGEKPWNRMKEEETTFRATRQLKGNQRQGGECAFRGHSEVGGARWGVLRGGGTNPPGELLNKHTQRLALEDSERC